VSTPSLTHTQIAEALASNGGLMSLAAKRLGVTRQAIHNRVKRSAELRQICEDQREEILDLAEAALKVSVTKREAWAVCFTLKTIGKQRGYIEHSTADITSGGKAIRFTLNIGGAGNDPDPDEA
jgi:hypothetical protein